MDEKIANNKGGLFNRQTCKLFLKPFKLAEIVEQTKLNGNGDLTAVLSEESACFARADKESRRGGAQIDMLIKRRDRVITICEIKFSNGEYQIIMDDLFYR